MYFAEYDIDGMPWLQLGASVRLPTRPTVDRAESFWDRFRGVLRSWDLIQQSGTAVRVQLSAELRVSLFLVAPRERAQALQNAAGSLTQLEVFADAEVALAQGRIEHDALLRFPRFRCRTVLPTLAGSQAWFAFDFRVRHHLDELLIEAHALGHALSYHVNVERFAIEAACQRTAALNALRVADTPGVGGPLVELQNRLAQNLRRASHVCEEYVGVETPAACEWLQRTLEQRFQNAYGVFIQPDFAFEEGTHDAQLATTRHTVCFESIEPHEVCASAITADERIEVLSWQPKSFLLGLVTKGSVVETTPASPPDLSGMPSVYAGDEPFVFVSYSHSDSQRINSLLTGLSTIGYRLWFDKGIPGGAEWDALIEDRLRRSAVLLLFVSRRAVESKFVRREAKFADSLNKPIVSVLLEDGVELSHGLGMLLTQYQMLHVSGGVAEVARAVEFVQLPTK